MSTLAKQPTRVRNPLGEIFSTLTEDPFFRRPAAFFEASDLAVDVSEGDGAVIVRANLPGFQKEEIDVQFQNGVLTINAEHDEVNEAKNEKFYRKERRFGHVSRSVTIPTMVAEDGIKAELTDGVLTVRLRQAESVKSRRIAVK